MTKRINRETQQSFTSLIYFAASLGQNINGCISDKDGFTKSETVPVSIIWSTTQHFDYFDIGYISSSAFVKQKTPSTIHLKRLDGFEKLSPSIGIAPNKNTINEAKALLLLIDSIESNMVSIEPLGEGGIAIQFCLDNILVVIDLYNEGEYVFLTKKPDEESIALDFTSFDKLEEAIEDQLSLQSFV